MDNVIKKNSSRDNSHMGYILSSHDSFVNVCLLLYTSLRNRIIIVIIIIIIIIINIIIINVYYHVTLESKDTHSHIEINEFVYV